MFIISDGDDQCRTFDTEEELISFLTEPSHELYIRHIYRAEECREHYCKVAFDAWWDSYMRTLGNEARHATSSAAPAFLGELMGAIWLERKISDKCSESGK